MLLNFYLKSLKFHTSEKKLNYFLFNGVSFTFFLERHLPKIWCVHKLEWKKKDGIKRILLFHLFHHRLIFQYTFKLKNILLKLIEKKPTWIKSIVEINLCLSSIWYFTHAQCISYIPFSFVFSLFSKFVSVHAIFVCVELHVLMMKYFFNLIFNNY